MAKTLIQKANFKGVRPERLYQIYMNSTQHSKATGGKAVVQNKTGGNFTAFGGMLKGKFLKLEKGKRIVQTWRAKPWKKRDGDSILILSFKKIQGGASVELVHEGLPDHDYQGVKKGWAQYYWRPWRSYLKKK